MTTARKYFAGALTERLDDAKALRSAKVLLKNLHKVSDDAYFLSRHTTPKVQRRFTIAHDAVTKAVYAVTKAVEATQFDVMG